MRYKLTGTFRSGTGVVISGGTVSVFLSGTTTPADIYETATSTTIVNSTTSGADGTFTFYILEGDFYGDHTRKVVLSKTGFTSVTYDYVEPVDFYNGPFTQATIEAALTAIGTTNKVTLLLRPGAWAITSALSIPANVSLKMPSGSYFNCTGSGAVTFVSGANRVVTPEMWGLSLTATAAVNAAALQASIDSSAAEVIPPAGVYDYSIGITFDRAIRFDGAGAPEKNAAAGASTTTLNYTGAGTAIDIVGTSVNGKQNIHLSNFLLKGTSSATAGIYVGSDTNITNSSLKNITVYGFTSGPGVKIGNFLLSMLENVTSKGNYYGFVNAIGKTSTTLKFINTYAGGNTTSGYYFNGSMINCMFIGATSESNYQEGLVLAGSGIIANTFYGYHSESNQITSGTAPIVITGTAGTGAPKYNNFFGGWVNDPVGVLSISLDYAERNTFNNLIIGAYGAGFMQVTANSLYNAFNTWSTEATNEKVTGNHYDGVYVNSGNMPSKFGAIMAANAGANLPWLVGVVVVTDVTKNKSAIVSLNGANAAVTILADPDSGFSTTAVNEKIEIYANAGIYKVANITAGANPATVIMSTLNVGGF
jgi:hypothetical protein